MKCGHRPEASTGAFIEVGFLLKMLIKSMRSLLECRRQIFVDRGGHARDTLHALGRSPSVAEGAARLWWRLHIAIQCVPISEIASVITSMRHPGPAMIKIPNDSVPMCVVSMRGGRF